MNKIILSLAAAASFGGAVPAAAAEPETPAVQEEEEVRVPFLHVGRFRTFRATDERTLYIRATNRQWYRITTMGPCPNLPWARAIGIDNHSAAWLDRFSTLIVEGDRCPVNSVVRSGEPPRRERSGGR